MKYIRLLTCVGWASCLYTARRRQIIYTWERVCDLWGKLKFRVINLSNNICLKIVREVHSTRFEIIDEFRKYIGSDITYDFPFNSTAISRKFPQEGQMKVEHFRSLTAWIFVDLERSMDESVSHVIGLTRRE